MKSSYYNILVKNNSNNVICYNTKQDAFILLSNSDADSLLHNIDKLTKNSPNLVNNLLKTGFIVEDDVDEFSLLENEYTTAKNDNSTFSLTILPTLDCNLRCWYCFEKQIKGSHLTLKVSEAILSLVKMKLKEDTLKNIKILLFGGEPLLYFESELYPLLKKIKDETLKAGKHVFFSFVTNAVCINDNNIPFFDELDASFQISIDGYKERHDKVKFIPETGEGTYDSMIKKLYSLTERLKNVHINLRINYDDETLNQMPELIEQLKDIDRNKISVHLERIWQTDGKPFNNEELRDMISLWIANGFNVSYMNMTRRSYSCIASLNNHVVVSWDGSVFKCTGRDFTKLHKEGQIMSNGNIKWDEKKLKKRLEIVTYNNNMCKTCKFLPLCWGPCCQKQLECSDGNFIRYCQKRIMELKIDDFIKYKFNNAYINPRSFRDKIEKN